MKVHTNLYSLMSPCLTLPGALQTEEKSSKQCLISVRLKEVLQLQLDLTLLLHRLPVMTRLKCVIIMAVSILGGKQQPVLCGSLLLIGSSPGLLSIGTADLV